MVKDWSPHTLNKKNVWPSCRKNKIQDHQCYKITLFPDALRVHHVLNAVFISTKEFEQHSKSVTTVNQAPHNVLPVLRLLEKTLKLLLAILLYFKIHSTHFLNRSQRQLAIHYTSFTQTEQHTNSECTEQSLLHKIIWKSPKQPEKL